jgi:hypothetical protein
MFNDEILFIVMYIYAILVFQWILRHVMSPPGQSFIW